MYLGCAGEALESVDVPLGVVIRDGAEDSWKA